MIYVEKYKMHKYGAFPALKRIIIVSGLNKERRQMKHYKVAILGATGAVGREMMKILEEREFPISELHLLASAVLQARSFPGKGRI